jgi:hypothetical protein
MESTIREVSELPEDEKRRFVERLKELVPIVVLSLLGREKGNETVRTTTTTDARSRGKREVVEGRLTDSRGE